MHWIAPQKFTLNRWCMLSRLPPAMGANSPTPALFTNTSTLSNSSTVRRTSASTAKRSRTSVGHPTRAPARPIPEEAPVMITARPSTCIGPSSNGAHAEPLRELGPQPEQGVAPGDQAHVPALQDDVFL